MKTVMTLLATSLALAAGAWWAFTRGAHFELRDYSPPERMQLLDTTTIGEQWALAGVMLATLSAITLILAAATYLRGRKKSLV
ncbi:MAG TPA: hypothetical protein VF668_22420 [Pyrinomonadaceae bacterium]|jgi:hypothetical protein